MTLRTGMRSLLLGLCVLLGIGYGPVHAQATLVADYRFDDVAWCTPASALDSVGGHHGTLMGSVGWQDSPASGGKPVNGAAVSFSSGAIDITGLPLNLATGASNSVSFWMYWDGVNNAMPLGFGLHDLWLQSGSFGFNTFNSDIFGISSTGLSGGWHHVAAVFTNGNVAANKLWIDGVPQVLTQRSTTPNNANAVASSHLRLSGVWGNSAYLFGGSLDVVRIYSGLLTQSQVDQDRVLTSPAVACPAPPAPTLVAHYRLEDAWDVSHTAANTVPGGANGDFSTAYPSKIAAPAVAPNKPNTCFGASFSTASGPLLSTGNVLNLNAGGKNSVSFWMYWNGGDSQMPFGFDRYDLWLQGGAFGFNSGNSDIYGISSAGLSNGWHHVAAVFTNANIVGNKLWIDGAPQVLSQQKSSPNNTVAYAKSTFQFSGWATSSGYRFAGSLDELKVYQGEMTDAMVLSDFTDICGAPPSTCITDNFSAGLNTALWNVSGTGYTPQVVSSPTVPTSRLRLTDNGSNRSTMAQLKKWFPAANNKVVIEFDYYVYGGSGADGIAVVLSDASVSPTAGGYGGSLGYANRSGINGFNGGWLGIGLDEFGNYPNTTEGRRGYPAGYTPPIGANKAAGFYASSIGVRGSGVSQVSGYQLLANTGVVTPSLTTTNTVPQRYRVTLDHSNSLNAYVTVERNTGAGYTTVVPTFDAKGPNSGQAAVPANMLLSFTGSTGGATNFHEIGNLSVCATRMTDPGGSADAANFECLETGVLPTWSTTARHPLYTKLADTNFKFDIVALKTDGTIENSYIAAGGNAKDVTVALFDDSASPSPVCSAYAAPVATQTVTYVSGDDGRKTITSNFNLNRAWGKLRCRVTDANAASTVYGCSTDRFSVRPQSFNSVSSSANGDNAGTSNSATTVVKAGASFSLSAGTGKIGYGGLPKINASLAEWPNVPAGGRAAPGVGILGGVFTTAASSASGNGATGAAFTYSDVGYFRLQAQGVYDDTFTAQSADTTNGDCTDDFSNTLVGGKYGCKFGNTAATNHFGRFIPDHFRVLPPVFTPGCGAGGFSYMDQPFALSATIEAQNSGYARTQNYAGSFANGAVSVQMENANSGVPLANSRLGGLGSPAWAAGSYSFVATQFLKLAGGPDGPYDLLDIGLVVADEGTLPAASRPYLMVRDMDASNTSCTLDMTGLPTAAGVCSATRIVTAGKIRYGRVRLQNTNGSELLNLPLDMRLQYWAGTATGWQTNVADTCTAIQASDFAFSFPGAGNPLAACETAITISGVAPNYTASLTKPGVGNNGWTDITLNLGVTAAGNRCTSVGTSGAASSTANAPWLQFNWTGAVGNPVARATFGVYRSGPIIHRREMY